jgi:hypothetical protein
MTLLDWWRTRRHAIAAKAALLAHQAATGHRGSYVTRYSDGRVIEHCMDCDYGLPDPR